MARLEKSEIVQPIFKKVEPKPINQLLELPELPELKLSKLERLQIKVNTAKKKIKYGSKFTLNYLKLFKELRMDNSPITTKLGNKAFWLKVIATILAMLGFLGIEFDLSPGITEQIALFLSSGVSLVIGFFFDKKTAEETQDKK